MHEIRYSCRLELREDASMRGPGRLSGTLLRYNEQAADRPELFESGALTWPSAGVVLRRQHSRHRPITRVVPEERDGAVVIDHPLPDTEAGRDAAREIRAGLFSGLSVEFVAKRERHAGGLRRIAKAELVGAGLVDSPSYPSSTVEARHKTDRMEACTWL